MCKKTNDFGSEYFENFILSKIQFVVVFSRQYQLNLKGTNYDRNSKFTVSFHHF